MRKMPKIDTSYNDNVGITSDSEKDYGPDVDRILESISGKSSKPFPVRPISPTFSGAGSSSSSKSPRNGFSAPQVDPDIVTLRQLAKSPVVIKLKDEFVGKAVSALPGLVRASAHAFKPR